MQQEQLMRVSGPSVPRGLVGFIAEHDGDGISVLRARWVGHEKGISVRMKGNPSRRDIFQGLQHLVNKLAETVEV